MLTSDTAHSNKAQYKIQIPEEPCASWEVKFYKDDWTLKNEAFIYLFGLTDQQGCLNKYFLYVPYYINFSLAERMSFYTLQGPSSNDSVVSLKTLLLLPYIYEQPFHLLTPHTTYTLAPLPPTPIQMMVCKNVLPLLICNASFISRISFGLTLTLSNIRTAMSLSHSFHLLGSFFFFHSLTEYFDIFAGL